jgi:hypothetical protein
MGDQELPVRIEMSVRVFMNTYNAF